MRRAPGPRPAARGPARRGRRRPPPAVLAPLLGGAAAAWAALACEPLAAFAELGARGWSAGDQNAGGRGHESPGGAQFGRRGLHGLLLAGLGLPLEANAVTPTTPFEWSFLWNQPGAESVPKTPGLAAERVAEILRTDLADNMYTLTGKLSPGIFRDDCRFVDPNNAVDGLAKYRQALGFLFDPAVSTLRLDGIRVTGANVIEADYVAEGTIKLPWRPRIDPWAGHLVYTLDDSGLIAQQQDTWNITRFDAIRQTFTPR